MPYTPVHKITKKTHDGENLWVETGLSFKKPQTSQEKAAEHSEWLNTVEACKQRRSNQRK